MAARVVFEPDAAAESCVNEWLAEFEWVPGMAMSQQRKCVRNLHHAVVESNPDLRPLEVSTRSESILGQSLSAFNLQSTFVGQTTSVESAYQGSKVFESGGPFTDLYEASSAAARRDPRLHSSGRLVGFSAQNLEWNLSTAPSFYDYLYVSSLLENEDLLAGLSEFNAFTDLAYAQTSLTPKRGKSFNCQARSVAMYLGLKARGDFGGILDDWRKKLCSPLGNPSHLGEQGFLFNV